MKPNPPTTAIVHNPPDNVVGLTLFEGPLPPPEQLAEYERAFPGAADRIFSMAEKLQQADIAQNRFTQVSEFIISAFGHMFLYCLVLAAVYLAINDKPLEAFFAGLAPMAIAIYANTRKKPKDDHDET